MKHLGNQNIGFGLVVADMFVYGLFPVFAHYFIATIDPILFGGITTLVGSIPLLLILHVKKKTTDLHSPVFTKPLLLIAFLTTIANITFFYGTGLTSGINTGLLVQIEPFYAMLIGIFLLGEVVGFGQFAATLIMVIGAIVVVYNGFQNLNLGDLLILITPIFYQLSHVVSKKILNKVSDVYIIPAARLLYGGIALTILALILNPQSISQLLNLKNIGSIVFFGLIFRALDFSLWYGAIKRIPVSKASAILPFAAAVSFFFSIIFLKETANMRQLIGLFLIFGGLLWVSILHIKDSKKTSR